MIRDLSRFAFFAELHVLPMDAHGETAAQQLTLRTLAGETICVATVAPDQQIKELADLAWEGLGQPPGTVQLLGQSGLLETTAEVGDHFTDGADVQVTVSFDQHMADKQLVHAAHVSGDTGAVQKLLRAGADKEAKNDKRETVLIKVVF